jgi:hypothetical protein
MVSPFIKLASTQTHSVIHRFPEVLPSEAAESSDDDDAGEES